MLSASDGRGLLDDILQNPESDSPRLIFADWLEEGGGAERAEFVRVQILLAALDAAGHTPDPWHAHPRKECPQQYEAGGCEDCSRMIVATRRSNDLLLSGANPLHSAWREWAGPALGLVEVGARFDHHLTFRRGFVESVRCPLAAFREHGKSITTAHPVARVELTDRKAWEGRARNPEPVTFWGWWTDCLLLDSLSPEIELPLSILDVLARDRRRKTSPHDYHAGHGGHGGVFFGSPGDCADATSDALLAWARRQDEPPREYVLDGERVDEPTWRRCRAEVDAERRRGELRL